MLQNVSVTAFTVSKLFYDWRNIALSFNSAFSFLILLPSIPGFLQNSVLHTLYGFKNAFCSNYDTLWFF